MEMSSEGSGKRPGPKASNRLSSPPRVVSLPAPQPQGPPALKPVHRFIPTSWKNLFQRRPAFAYLPSSFRISPPMSPCAEHLSCGDQEGSRDGEDSESCGDFKETPSTSTTLTRSGKTVTVAASQGGLSSGPPSYREKLEAYDQKFSYMKSWPGLLRFLGGLELLLGGMVFACTAAYIQKDYQWTELYGGGLPLYPGGYGYNYYGPMTPFVLVVTSLAWLVTVILLGLGVTMYYRTILLGSHWWPLTEFALNLLMFLFYMAAAIAYVDDVNRGGLCYSIFARNPLIVALCRVEGGQVAAIAFLFINTLLYLAGALVSLKMRKHQVARNEAADAKPIFLEVVPKQGTPTPSRALPLGKVPKHVEFSEEGEEPKTLNYAIPTGHKPKPHVVPDYVMKYPAIGSQEDQQRYKAVFNDQYAEYKELHHEVQVMLQRFKELDALMSRLPQHPQSKMEKARLSAVWKEYESKRKDPTFLEKQERCAYLKAKLSHLKVQIQAFNLKASESSVYF